MILMDFLNLENLILFLKCLISGKSEYSHTGDYFSVHKSKIMLLPDDDIGVFYAYSGGKQFSKQLQRVCDTLDPILLHYVTQEPMSDELHSNITHLILEGMQFVCPFCTTIRALYYNPAWWLVMVIGHLFGWWAVSDKLQYISAGCPSHKKGGNSRSNPKFGALDTRVQSAVLLTSTDIKKTRPTFTKDLLGVFEHPFLGMVGF